MTFEYMTINLDSLLFETIHSNMFSNCNIKSVKKKLGRNFSVSRRRENLARNQIDFQISIGHYCTKFVNYQAKI